MRFKETVDITDLVTQICIEKSPAEMVDANSLKKWYRANGIKYILEATQTKAINYDVESFNFKEISDKKKNLWYNQEQLEKEYYFLTTLHK